MSQTVLITGGAGYIGSHANSVLAARGYETLVLDNLVYGHKDLVQWGKLIVGYISDTALLQQVFSTYHIDAVMHFAAYTYVGESVTDPAKYYLNNVGGTLNLLRAMQRAGVNKLIFSSTCATYGVPQEIPLTESHPQNPINPYGRTKLMIEQAMADFSQAYGLQYLALRYFNAAGADPQSRVGERHDPETHLIPLTLLAGLVPHKTLKIFGTDYETPDGTCVRDYIHVTDLAEAHALGLEYLLDGGTSNAFNLGNGQGFSVREIIESARRVSGQEIPAIEAERRAGDPPFLVGSAEKIHSVLGWKPQFTNIDAIVSTAWNWHKKDLGL